MKKFITMILMSVLALGVSAQVLTSRTYNKPKGKTQWHVRVGPSFNNIAGVGDATYDKTYEGGSEKFSFGTSTGMSLDFGFSKDISKSGLYWGMELGLGTRGFTAKYEETDAEGYWETDKATLRTWNIKYSPFTFGYKYSVTDDLKIDAHVGVFASYDFAGSYKVSIDNNWSDPNSYLDDDDEIAWDDVVDNKFDIGTQLGIGVWYKRFNFDIMWQRGFMSMAEYECYDTSDDRWSYKSGYSSNLVLRVGYTF